MLYGIRDAEQLRLAEAGNHVRVYVPFGTEWYGYFVRRLAERPANLTFFLRALAERGANATSRCGEGGFSAQNCTLTGRVDAAARGHDRLGFPQITTA